MLSVPITVIIPCHNHEQWVAEAINSALNQDYPSDLREIIVVDDGSTDSSRMVASSALSGQNGKIIHLDKAYGPSYARNRGMEAANPHSKVFFFLDSDDAYLSGKIRQSVEVWQAAPDVIGVVYSDYVTTSIETGRTMEQQKWPFDRRLLLCECLPNCDSLISKKAIEEIGGFDEELRCVEDYDLWLRISERYILHHIAEPLIKIRVGSHSSTSTVDKQKWNECYARVFAKHHQRNPPISA